MTAGHMVEIHDLAKLAVGSVGPPGERVFMIEAVGETEHAVVVVEKEQVAMLVSEATQFLDQIAQQYPEERAYVDPVHSVLEHSDDPLFRARMIGLGYDPSTGLVLLELREEASDDDDEDEDYVVDEEAPDVHEGWVARAYASRAQLRALIAAGADTVMAGRSRWN